jgi:hypothetical protein
MFLEMFSAVLVGSGIAGYLVCKYIDERLETVTQMHGLKSPEYLELTDLIVQGQRNNGEIQQQIKAHCFHIEALMEKWRQEPLIDQPVKTTGSKRRKWTEEQKKIASDLKKQWHADRKARERNAPEPSKIKRQLDQDSQA